MLLLTKFFFQNLVQGVFAFWAYKTKKIMTTTKSISVGTIVSATAILLIVLHLTGNINIWGGETISDSIQLEELKAELRSMDQKERTATLEMLQYYRMLIIYLEHRQKLVNICDADKFSVACEYLKEITAYDWINIYDAYNEIRNIQIRAGHGLAFIVKNERGTMGQIIIPRSDLMKQQIQDFFENQFEHYCNEVFGISPSSPEAKDWNNIPFYGFHYDGKYFRISLKKGREMEAERFMTERTGGHFWLHKQIGNGPRILLPNTIGQKHSWIIKNVIEKNYPKKR